MKLGKLQSIDFERLLQDFKGLDPNDPGAWPLAPRIAVFVALLAAVLALAWWFDWRDQVSLLDQRVAEEAQLREDWRNKKAQAVNLDAYKLQLEEIDRQFGALLKQLPNRAEMDSLLSDINQAGVGRGLQFDLFKPGVDVVKDFYAEMPIDVRIVGAYNDLGAFAEDVARMPRIVTLDNVAIEAQKDGMLKLEAKAITYRYLDEEELAQKRAQEKAAKTKGGK
ncbi:type 4a pilus biogenesis protein PilO [Azoarcus sp. DN11]|uniref:type 4a pilus biogenesis protein PilO n=1 Tax=Azoarcus sp. DN11 TaxID=356837 RepID=UPI000EB17E5B|nr:type 4a pilus biogenesis protein PilO [Azoarcus sp. DN11]AYH45701.1 pilus assembly protein PilO [Azoarcus sp. DN11]